MRRLIAWTLVGSMVGMVLPSQVQARPVDDARREFYRDMLPQNATAAAAPEQIEFQAMQAKAYAMRNVQLPEELIKALLAKPPQSIPDPILPVDPSLPPIEILPVRPPPLPCPIPIDPSHIGFSAVANYLGIDKDQIASVRMAKEIEFGRLAVEVHLKDGRRYVGEFQRLIHTMGPESRGPGFFPFAVDWLVESNVGVETLKNIAAALGIDVRDLAKVATSAYSLSSDEALTRESVKTGVEVSLKDGRHFVGMLSGYRNPGIPIEFKPFGGPVYSVSWLVHTTLDVLAVQKIARFLGIDPSRISSIRTENDFRRIFAEGYPRLIKLSPLAIDVELKDGRHYVGELSSNFRVLRHGFVGDYYPAMSSYRVRWLVESNVGVETLKNIAAALGIDVRDLASVRQDGYWNVGQYDDLMSERPRARVTLKDGREFTAELISTNMPNRDSLGYAVYRVQSITPLVMDGLEPAELAALKQAIESIQVALNVIDRALEALGRVDEFRRGPLTIGKEHLQRAFSLYRHLLMDLAKAGRGDTKALDHALAIMRAAQREFRIALAILPDIEIYILENYLPGPLERPVGLLEFLKHAEESLGSASRSVIELSVRMDNRKIGEQISRLEDQMAGLRGPGAERARSLLGYINALLEARVREIDADKTPSQDQFRIGRPVDEVYHPTVYEYTQYLLTGLNNLRDLIRNDPSLSGQPWAREVLQSIHRVVAHLRRELSFMKLEGIGVLVRPIGPIDIEVGWPILRPIHRLEPIGSPVSDDQPMEAVR